VLVQVQQCGTLSCCTESCRPFAAGCRVSEQADGPDRVQLIKSSDMCLKLIK